MKHFLEHVFHRFCHFAKTFRITSVLSLSKWVILFWFCRRSFSFHLCFYSLINFNFVFSNCAEIFGKFLDDIHCKHAIDSEHRICKLRHASGFRYLSTYFPGSFPSSAKMRSHALWRSQDKIVDHQTCRQTLNPNMILDSKFIAVLAFCIDLVIQVVKSLFFLSNHGDRFFCRERSPLKPWREVNQRMQNMTLRTGLISLFSLLYKEALTITKLLPWLLPSNTLKLLHLRSIRNRYSNLFQDECIIRVIMKLILPAN